MHNKVLLFACSILLLCFSGCSKDSAPENEMPTLTTGEATDVSRKAATISGNISVPEGSEVRNCGFLYSTVSTLPEAESKTVSITLQGASNAYTTTLTGLTPNTKYYYCLYAGSGYSSVKGKIKDFVTSSKSISVIDTIVILGKSETGFKASTSILDDGGSNISTLGFCWKIVKQNADVPTIEDNTKILDNISEFTYEFTNLKTNDIYAVRAYAINEEGVAYSETVYVSLRDDNPMLSACKIVSVSDISLTVQAQIMTNKEGVTEKGICYSDKVTMPTMSCSIEKCSEEGAYINTVLKELRQGIQYYIRAYCIKGEEAFYGEVMSYVFGKREPGIYSLEDLIEFRDVYNTTKNLTKWLNKEREVNLYADIDMSSIENWIPIKQFQETFNGNGHYLTNFKIISYPPKNSGFNSEIGFFSSLVGGAVVKNLHIGEGSYIILKQMDLNGTFYVGGICGIGDKPGDKYPTISNCSSAASISLTSEDHIAVGGIAGQSVIIDHCSNFGKIDAISKQAYVGGIIGQYSEGKLEYCSNTGMIGTGYDCNTVGGIIGYKFGGSISNCVNSGTINGGSQSVYLGGICGLADANDYYPCSIEQNINQGTILNGKTNVGGILGAFIEGDTEVSVVSCTNKGEIHSSATNIGSICGQTSYYNFFEGNVNQGSVNGTVADYWAKIGKDLRGPRLGNTVVEKITSTTVTVTSEIIDIGGAPIIEKGICYSDNNKSPTLSRDIKVQEHTVGNKIKLTIENLASGTKYYLCAYAFNEFWCPFGCLLGDRAACGEVTSFTTILE